MKQNQTWTQETPHLVSTPSLMSSTSVEELLNHWAWKFHTYFFAALYIVFAVNCLIAFVRQSSRSVNKSVYRRFTTTQLFVAAVVKAAVLLWCPFLEREISRARYVTALVLFSFSKAFNLSAYSILLLVLLESTKVSIASPRLQNIWVLLGFTAVFTVTLATFNLLVLFADKELWRFISDLVLSTWGGLICFGYAVAGYRIWRNLRSSRDMDNSRRNRTLRTIVLLAFISSVVTAVSLTLIICVSAGDFGAIRGLQLKKDSNRARFAITFLMRSYEFGLVLLIFVTVVKTKTDRSRVEDAPSLPMGTFLNSSTKG